MSRVEPMPEFRPQARGQSMLVWSTHYFPPGSSLSMTSNSMFVLGRGFVGQGKDRPHDINDTNIKEPMRAPFPMLIHGIRWDVIHPDPVFRSSVLLSASWGLDLVQALIDGAPLAMTSLGTAIDEPTGIERTSTTHPFDASIQIEDGTRFSICLQFGENAPDVPMPEPQSKPFRIPFEERAPGLLGWLGGKRIGWTKEMRIEAGSNPRLRVRCTLSTTLLKPWKV